MKIGEDLCVRKKYKLIIPMCAPSINEQNHRAMKWGSNSFPLHGVANTMSALTV